VVQAIVLDALTHTPKRKIYHDFASIIRILSSCLLQEKPYFAASQDNCLIRQCASARHSLMNAASPIVIVRRLLAGGGKTP
jgi:hypothetical protein